MDFHTSSRRNFGGAEGRLPQSSAYRWRKIIDPKMLQTAQNQKKIVSNPQPDSTLSSVGTCFHGKSDWQNFWSEILIIFLEIAFFMFIEPVIFSGFSLIAPQAPLEKSVTTDQV